MKFLVTNDDGYKASGIKKIVEFLKTKGEVIVVAPEVEESAKSHAIDIRGEFSVKRVDEVFGCVAYAIGSTPADCVRYAIYALGIDDVDLIVSGINDGYNAGDDILYSGTVSAALEGALRGFNALALSAKRGCIERISDELERCFEIILDEELFQKWDCWNINIPLNFKEYVFAHQGDTFFFTYFLEGEMTRQLGEPHFEKEVDEISDVYALYREKMSITPLTTDRTKYFA